MSISGEITELFSIPTITGDGGKYTPNSVRFDGTNDYMTSNTGASVTDSPFFAMSCLFKAESTSGTLLSTRNARVFVGLNTGLLIVVLNNSSGTPLLAASSSPNLITTGVWYHLYIRASTNSLGTPYSEARITRLDNGVSTVYINTAPSSGSIDWTNSQFFIGGSAGGALLFNGSIADVWISQQNLENSLGYTQFITASGKPRNLGADGSTPTGQSPLIYLPNPFGTFNENESSLGVQGDFTVTGALTQGDALP